MFGWMSEGKTTLREVGLFNLAAASLTIVVFWFTITTPPLAGFIMNTNPGIHIPVPPFYNQILELEFRLIALLYAYPWLAYVIDRPVREVYEDH
jgi:hypothetical protein